MYRVVAPFSDNCFDFIGRQIFKQNAFQLFLDFVPRLNSIYRYWILPISICLIKKFHEVPLCVELEVSQLCWSEERLNHLLKIDDDKLFKDLLANKIFYRQILSCNFKMKFYLNRVLVWEFFGWKLIILTALFCKIKIRLILLKF